MPVVSTSAVCIFSNVSAAAINRMQSAPLPALSATWYLSHKVFAEALADYTQHAARRYSGAPLKYSAVGQYRQTSRAMLCVALGNLGGLKSDLNDAFGGARLLFLR